MGIEANVSDPAICTSICLKIVFYCWLEYYIKANSTGILNMKVTAYLDKEFFEKNSHKIWVILVPSPKLPNVWN